MSESNNKMSELLELLLKSSNLTRRQLLIWFGQQRHNEVPIYSIPFLWEFEEALDYERLQTAFQQVIQSNEALRTVFTMEGGIPTAIYKPTMDAEMDFVDLSNEEDSKLALKEWIRPRISSALDIEQHCFDTAFIKLKKGCAWFINEHHLITDGRSKQLVYEKTAGAYKQLGGQSDPDNLETVSYTEYVDFEKRSLEKRSSERAKAYWDTFQTQFTEGQLFPLSNSPSTHCERWTRDLEPDTLQRIQNLGNATEGDLAIVSGFISALICLLKRHKDQKQLTIGHTLAKRPVPKHQDILGLCLEVAPLGISISTEETFQTLRVKVMKQIMNGMMHLQHIPWNHSEKPIYDLLFNYLNLPFPSFNGNNPHTEWVYPCHQETALNVQVLNMNPGKAPQLVFDFSKDAIPHSERETLVDQFEAILKEMLQDATNPV